MSLLLSDASLVSRSRSVRLRFQASSFTSPIADRQARDNTTILPPSVRLDRIHKPWPVSKRSSRCPLYVTTMAWLLPPRQQTKPRCQQVLAIGFVLVILSSALFQNYLPLLVVATYVIAPVPNWLCGKAQNSDDFMDSGSNSIVELGKFITGFLVVMGIGEYTHSSADPHTDIISSTACCFCALRIDPNPGNGNEHRGRIVDIRHHHKFHTVLPSGGGILTMSISRRGLDALRWPDMTIWSFMA